MLLEAAKWFYCIKILLISKIPIFWVFRVYFAFRFFILDQDMTWIKLQTQQNSQYFDQETCACIPFISHLRQPNFAVGSGRHCIKYWAGLSQHALTRKTFTNASFIFSLLLDCSWNIRPFSSCFNSSTMPKAQESILVLELNAITSAPNTSEEIFRLRLRVWGWGCEIPSNYSKL